jgi:hypothetical protein
MQNERHHEEASKNKCGVLPMLGYGKYGEFVSKSLTAYRQK